MTPDDAPLVCSCGNHSAQYVPATGKKPAKWMVYAVKQAGNKPRPVTTLATKQKALDRVRSLCVASAEEIQPVAVAKQQQPPLRVRLRQPATLNYDDTARRGTREAGPGRGNKRLSDGEALATAQAILKKPKPTNEELRDALCKLTEQHQLLQRWYGKAVSDMNQAFALLREEYSSTSISNENMTTGIEVARRSHSVEV
jgi:hypothetical protein